MVNSLPHHSPQSLLLSPEARALPPLIIFSPTIGTKETVLSCPGSNLTAVPGRGKREKKREDQFIFAIKGATNDYYLCVIPGMIFNLFP